MLAEKQYPAGGAGGARRRSVQPADSSKGEEFEQQGLGLGRFYASGATSPGVGKIHARREPIASGSGKAWHILL